MPVPVSPKSLLLGTVLTWSNTGKLNKGQKDGWYMLQYAIPSAEKTDR